MGVFDWYGSVQLKVGHSAMCSYVIGDYVPIPDGVYVGHEGVIVTHNHRFIAEYTGINTKWGTQILPVDILKTD